MARFKRDKWLFGGLHIGVTQARDGTVYVFYYRDGWRHHGRASEWIVPGTADLS